MAVNNYHLAATLSCTSFPWQKKVQNLGTKQYSFLSLLHIFRLTMHISSVFLAHTTQNKTYNKPKLSIKQ